MSSGVLEVPQVGGLEYLLCYACVLLFKMCCSALSSIWLKMSMINKYAVGYYKVHGASGRGQHTFRFCTFIGVSET